MFIVLSLTLRTQIFIVTYEYFYTYYKKEE